jgi:hypothetical protein
VSRFALIRVCDEISCSMRGMRAYIEWFLVEKTEEWAKGGGQPPVVI